MPQYDELTIPILYSAEAEESLCGGVMICEEIPAEVRKYDLKPKDFFIIRNQWTWNAFLKLDGNLDIRTTWEMLEETVKPKDLKDFGGPARLTMLIGRCEDSNDVERDAQLIKEFSERRFALRIANRLAQVVYTLNEPFDLDDIVARLYNSRAKNSL